MSEFTSIPNLDLLLSSFLKIAPQSQRFSDTFYHILLNKYPRLRPLFYDTDMAMQKEKLMQSLSIVMINIRNPEAFASILKDLGRRHVRYGTVLDDYPLVGDALLQSLEQHLGEDWTPDVQATWTQAYQLMAHTMTAGAKEALAEQNNLQIERDLKTAAIASQLLLIGGLAIIAAFGYKVWHQIHVQSAPVIAPSTRAIIN